MLLLYEEEVFSFPLQCAGHRVQAFQYLAVLSALFFSFHSDVQYVFQTVVYTQDDRISPRIRGVVRPGETSRTDRLFTSEIQCMFVMPDYNGKKKNLI